MKGSVPSSGRRELHTEALIYLLGETQLTQVVGVSLEISIAAYVGGSVSS